MLGMPLRPSPRPVNKLPTNPTIGFHRIALVVQLHVTLAVLICRTLLCLLPHDDAHDP